MHDYISTTELLSASLSRGFDLGKGQPREHLSYLTKIGLLPPAKKKRNSRGFIEGYYPLTVIDRLEALSKMKNQGMTFSQMKWVLDGRKSMFEAGTIKQLPSSNFYPQDPTSTVNPLSFNFSSPQFSYLPILIIGILLGYLLAVSRGSALPPMINGVSAQDLTVSPTASTSQPAIDTNTESIYVVSVPKSHFGNLDKNINIKF